MAGKGVALVEKSQANIHLSVRHEVLHVVAGIGAIGIYLEHHQPVVSALTPLALTRPQELNIRKKPPRRQV